MKLKSTLSTDSAKMLLLCSCLFCSQHPCVQGVRRNTWETHLSSLERFNLFSETLQKSIPRQSFMQWTLPQIRSPSLRTGPETKVPFFSGRGEDIHWKQTQGIRKNMRLTIQKAIFNPSVLLPGISLGHLFQRLNT